MNKTLVLSVLLHVHQECIEFGLRVGISAIVMIFELGAPIYHNTQSILISAAGIYIV